MTNLSETPIRNPPVQILIKVHLSLLDSSLKTLLNSVLISDFLIFFIFSIKVDKFCDLPSLFVGQINDIVSAKSPT